MKFQIDQKVMVRDESDEMFCDGEIIDINEEEERALVEYETMYYAKRGWFTFEELRGWQEEWHDLSMETASWF